MRPKAKATIQPRSVKKGRMLLTAAMITEKAMVDSINREGRWTQPKAARVSVMEWATVNEVTTRRILMKEARSESEGSQWPSLRRRTEGRRSASRNRM